MKKENFYLKAITFIYGTYGKLDEYSISEINRFGNNSFMYMQVCLFLSAFLTFVTGNSTFAQWGYLLMFLPSLLLSEHIKRLGLYEIEIDASELKEARKAMRRRSFFNSLFSTSTLFLGLTLIFETILKQEIANTVISEHLYLIISTVVLIVFITDLPLSIRANYRRITIITED